MIFTINRPDTVTPLYQEGDAEAYKDGFAYVSIVRIDETEKGEDWGTVFVPELTGADQKTITVDYPLFVPGETASFVVQIEPINNPDRKYQYQERLRITIPEKDANAGCGEIYYYNVDTKDRIVGKQVDNKPVVTIHTCIPPQTVKKQSVEYFVGDSLTAEGELDWDHIHWFASYTKDISFDSHEKDIDIVFDDIDYFDDQFKVVKLRNSIQTNKIHAQTWFIFDVPGCSSPGEWRTKSFSSQLFEYTPAVDSYEPYSPEANGFEKNIWFGFRDSYFKVNDDNTVDYLSKEENVYKKGCGTFENGIIYVKVDYERYSSSNRYIFYKGNLKSISSHGFERTEGDAENVCGTWIWDSLIIKLNPDGTFYMEEKKNEIGYDRIWIYYDRGIIRLHWTEEKYGPDIEDYLYINDKIYTLFGSIKIESKSAFEPDVDIIE